VLGLLPVIVFVAGCGHFSSATERCLDGNRWAILALRNEIAEVPRGRTRELAAFRNVVLHPDAYDRVLFTRGPGANANYTAAARCLADQIAG
jgi:hypothetical protein